MDPVARFKLESALLRDKLGKGSVGASDTPSSPNPANAEKHTLGLSPNVTGRCSRDGFVSVCQPSLILNMPKVNRFLAIKIVPHQGRKWEGPWSGPEAPGWHVFWMVLSGHWREHS